MKIKNIILGASLIGLSTGALPAQVIYTVGVDGVDGQTTWESYTETLTTDTSVSGIEVFTPYGAAVTFPVSLMDGLNTVATFNLSFQGFNDAGANPEPYAIGLRNVEKTLIIDNNTITTGGENQNINGNEDLYFTISNITLVDAGYTQLQLNGIRTSGVESAENISIYKNSTEILTVTGGDAGSATAVNSILTVPATYAPLSNGDTFVIDMTSGSNFQLHSLTFAAVPEPAHYGLIAGALLFGLLIFRRRNS